MSETNEAKEPGRTLYEIMQRHGWDIASWPWVNVLMSLRLEWEKAERAVLDHYAPRLAILEAETRELHRKLSETLVEAQAQRAGRVEAEHRLGLLVNEAGRRVLAIRSRKLVRRLRKRIAELEAFEGSQTDAAMKGAQEVAALTERAEKAERERNEAVAKAEDALRALEIVKQNRDEARDHRAKAWAERDEARGALDILEHERNAARKERDEARAEVARLTAHLNPRPDAGLAGLAERESSTVALDASPTTPADAHPNGAGGPTRVEVKLPKVERRPPFRDWTDAARAKLVPGASVWWCGDALVEPHRVELTSVVQERGGREIVRTGPFMLALDNCDPLTIEPPATQAEPVRPAAPDLRRGDRIKSNLLGYEWEIMGAPEWSECSKRWLVPAQSPGLVYIRTDDLDFATRVRTWQPGEVVPQAPLTVKRVDADCPVALGSGDICRCPLAEPWTQTGV